MCEKCGDVNRNTISLVKHREYSHRQLVTQPIKPEDLKMQLLRFPKQDNLVYTTAPVPANYEPVASIKDFFTDESRTVFLESGPFQFEKLPRMPHPFS